MLEHVWKRRIDSGYLFLGDWHESIPGEKRQTAIDQKIGWMLTVTETDEVAHMDDLGDPIYATEEQIAAAKLLPFNQRLYNLPRGTVGPDFYDEGQDAQTAPEPSVADQPMPDASVPEVIEIDDTFAPSADSPPGTEGRDANNQAPVNTPGVEFVSVTADMPKQGDTEVDPVPITEEEELHVSNDPLRMRTTSTNFSKITFNPPSNKALKTKTSQMMTLMKRLCSRNRSLCQCMPIHVRSQVSPTS